MRRPLLAAMALLLAIAPVAAQRGGQRSAFPHQRHATLFPLCEGCHEGIRTGNAALTFPSEDVCRNCHNGTDEREVTWHRPQRGQGLLHFSHPEHAGQTDSASRACTVCHAVASPRSRMDVERARPENCLGCHTHRAPAHLSEENRCATCHVALTAATGLTVERIAALPRPPSHEQPGFISGHRPGSDLAAASCATCHARESCARCHVNASTLPLVASLGSDARVASLAAGREAVYPLPLDHEGAGFPTGHGAEARERPERCATCHARPSCTTCHTGSGASDVLGRLPAGDKAGPSGVRLMLPPSSVRGRPPVGLLVARAETLPAKAPRVVRVHEDGFRLAHGTQAAAGRLTCDGCHAQQFCSDCHAGENQRRFHPANFTQRHAADSYGRESDCAACHNTEAFCRTCHQQSGLASKGRLDAAFHNAQPQWLLQHGRAARQGLQSCTTCHAQRDCLTCHSTLGWGVSPHGPGFQAERLATRNATQCLMCHLKVPGRN